MMGAPWMKFYPADWRSDPKLRMCSIAARGLWMEMLCLMHEATPVGHLLVNGKVVTDRQLASLAGTQPKEIENLTAELESAGVFSRGDNQIIFSRRMVRDDEKAKRDKANGKGGGNPTLMGGVNPPDNPDDNGGDKAQIPEAREQNLDRKGSEANASGAETPKIVPIDARTALFREGVPGLRTLTGKSDGQARSLIGKWLKDTGDDAASVHQAIQQAIDLRPAQPIPWLEAALKARTNPAEINYRAVL